MTQKLLNQVGLFILPEDARHVDETALLEYRDLGIFVRIAAEKTLTNVRVG